MIKELEIDNKYYVFDGNALELYEKDDEYPDETIENFDCEVRLEEILIPSNYLAKVTLNLCNDCNLKCAYCYADHGKYGREASIMSVNTVDKIIQFIVDRGFKSINVVALFGGEPLLNYKVLEYAILKFEEKFEKIYNFEVTTNGTCLTKKRLEFLSNHHVKLVLSIDGPKEITDLLRGNGTYDAVMKAIKLAKEINYEELEVSATYTKKHHDLGYTYNDIMEFFDKLEIVSSISKVSISKDSPLYIDDSISIDEYREMVNRELNEIQHGKSRILNPYLYRFLSGIIYDIRSFQFCDDLNLNRSMAFDVDGECYNCFRLWGREEYKLRGELVNSVLEKNNKKENFEICKKCWAKYLCKDCTVEFTLGEIDFPINDGICKTQIMYEICLEEFIKFMNKNGIEKLVNQFNKYFRYKN